jgi:uncharacterized protein (DUF58 family)
MPTSKGWAVGGIGVALIASGRLFGSRPSEQLGFALIVLVLIACAVALLRRHELVVTRDVVPLRARAEQPVQVSLRIINRGRPVPSVLLVEDHVPSELSGSARFAFGELEGEGRREASYSMRPSRRGRYLIGPTWISFLDPFGLARTKRRIADPSTMLVHPRVEPLSPPRDVGQLRSSAASALSQPAVARGEDFYTLRDYVEGDDLRRVHWSSTAKRDRYMIRQEETPWHTKATIVLDDRGSRPPELFERVVEAAASLADLYHRSGYSFQLLCASRRGVGFGRGSHHLTRCLDLLGLLKAKEQLILRQALGPAAEAVALQFLDDLGQASILGVPRQDHRLQHIRIVGKLVRRHRHDRMRPYSPAPGDNGIEADSLGRGSARLRRNARPTRFMDPPPVQPVEQRRQLSGRQPHHSILHLRPAELAILQPLRIEAHAGAVPEDQLDPIRALGTEDIDRTAEGIGVHRLAHQRGQTLRPLAEVHRLRRHHAGDGPARAASASGRRT